MRNKFSKEFQEEAEKLISKLAFDWIHLYIESEIKKKTNKKLIELNKVVLVYFGD